MLTGYDGLFFIVVRSNRALLSVESHGCLVNSISLQTVFSSKAFNVVCLALVLFNLLLIVPTNGTLLRKSR